MPIQQSQDRPKPPPEQRAETLSGKSLPQVTQGEYLLSIGQLSLIALDCFRLPHALKYPHHAEGRNIRHDFYNRRRAAMN